MTFEKTMWHGLLKEEFEKDYYQTLMQKIDAAYLEETIYPKKEAIYRAFELTDFEAVKVVILGQDPYHGEGQAMGLSFSVPDHLKLPPSLRNIYKELASDLQEDLPQGGDLSHWATQGVLLLNTVLTVPAGCANGHRKLGWETFTSKALQVLAERDKPLVCILWGNQAIAYESLFTKANQLVIKCVHPSPLSAHRGFFGSKPFSQTNDFLKAHGVSPIKWTKDEAKQLTLDLGVTEN